MPPASKAAPTLDTGITQARESSATPKPPSRKLPRNQALLRLQRKCSYDGAGSCESCNPAKNPEIQTKVPIGPRDDAFEREADATADRIMRMHAPEPPRLAQAPAQVKRAGGEQEDELDPGLVQRKPASMTAGHFAPPIVHDVLRSPGYPLDDATRAFFEPRFGHDLSKVRVHSGAAAEQSASDVNARAYTVGHNIVFGPGRFAPQTREGQRLLAHELAHVTQQRGLDASINQDATSVGAQGDSVEHAADTAAAAPLQPGITPVHLAPAGPLGVLWRSPDPPPPAKAPTGPQTSAAPKNSADAEAKTLTFYPKDADLEKAFARFKGIPEISAITDPAKRRAFLARMSLYLGPHPAAENHFAKIKRAKFGKDQWAFEPVVDRLNAVHDELKAKGHAMPESGSNFGLRGRWDGPVLPRGLMVHVLGLALDYRAETNVHIKDPRLIDLQSIFVSEAMRINVGKWPDRRAFVLKMGQGKASPKEVADFDARFHSQFGAAALGSRAMQSILPREEVARLSELSKEYKALKESERKLGAREKKVPELERSGINYWDEKAGFIGVGGSPRWEKLKAERQALSEERESLGTETYLLTDPVRQKVQEEMDRYLEKNPELSNLPDAGDLESEHALSAAAFKTADAAFKKAKKAMDAAKKKVASSNAAYARAFDANQTKPSARLEKLVADAGDKVDEAQGASLAAEKAFDEAKQALESATAERDKWEGKYAFIKQERWYERLRTLRDALADDLDFVLVGKRTVEDPPVSQLLEKGYFNPDEPGKGGFDELFMTTMAHHGFDQGAEWEPGGVDSMHFELAEEVEKLSQPEDAKQKEKKK